MDVTLIEMDPDNALDLYREYKKDRAYSTPEDAEIRRAYQLLSQGKVIIRAIESIKAAGLNAQGLPKLAIACATAKACRLVISSQGAAIMGSREQAPSFWGRPGKHDIRFEPGDFGAALVPPRFGHNVATAPTIPLKLRPKRGLENYHVLWEAEWTPVPTRDPYLLRRIGQSDLWLVCAHWDLTEVERAVLATRMVTN